MTAFPSLYVSKLIQPVELDKVELLQPLNRNLHCRLLRRFDQALARVLVRVQASYFLTDSSCHTSQFLSAF